MLTLLLSNFIASVLGLLVGYLLGRISREVHEVHEAVAADKHARPKGLVMSSKPPRERRPFWEKGWRRFLGLILFLMGSAVVVNAYISTVAQGRQNDCFRSALAARGQLQQQDNILLTDMLKAVIDREATPEQRQDALRTFISKRAQIEKQRQEHPLDEETCRD